GEKRSLTAAARRDISYPMKISRKSGKHGEKPTAIDITFGDADPNAEIFQTVHELRRTPQGRKYLTQAGTSMKGYKDGQASQYRSSIPFTERRFVAWDGERSEERRVGKGEW